PTPTKKSQNRPSTLLPIMKDAADGIAKTRKKRSFFSKKPSSSWWGIAIYGTIYFLIHDVYIHRRFKWFKQLDSKYSRAILRAHGHHHAITTKEGAESFGLLVVDKKYFKKRSEWKKAQKSERAKPESA
ncbi:MAG: hypothetical protein AAFN65_05710, partial [Bacteroidota bacterium]